MKECEMLTKTLKKTIQLINDDSYLSDILCNTVDLSINYTISDVDVKFAIILNNGILSLLINEHVDDDDIHIKATYKVFNRLAMGNFISVSSLSKSEFSLIKGTMGDLLILNAIPISKYYSEAFTYVE